MFQRTWRRPRTEPSAPGAVPARPRVLVEESSEVNRYSDFSLFRAAGFDVAICSGPDESSDCPLVHDVGGCPLVDESDVVLFGLDLGDPDVRDVLHAHLVRNPDRPVVVELPRARKTFLPGADVVEVLRAPSTVTGQTRALWNALRRRRRPSAAPRETRPTS